MQLVRTFVLCLLLFASESFALLRYRATRKLHFGNSNFGIDLTRRSFIKDAIPFRYIAGEIHYFRIHPSLWADRLERVRHLGMNAIQVNVPWNFHQDDKDVIDFKSETRDLARFLRLATENHLNVLLRIGPYICSEVGNGGLPWWLLKNANVSLRTSDPNFLDPVKKYFDVLLPLVNSQLYINKRKGPILMLQIENEYGSFGVCDKVYMEWLRDTVRSYLGKDVTLYTVDGANAQLLKCGTISDVYATINFGAELDGKVDDLFSAQHKFVDGGPNVASEFYTTWFSQWGDCGVPKQEVNRAIDIMSNMYSLNASFTLYMVHGGTNFAFLNGNEQSGPVATSYDYGAPISEAGNITPLYVAIRNWIKKLPNWPQPPLDVPANISATALPKIETTYFHSLRTTMRILIDKSNCVPSEFPQTFEQFESPYLFILYSTIITDRILPKEPNATHLLNVSGIKDVGYVYLDDEFQGFVSSLCEMNGRREWCRPSLMLHTKKTKKPLAGRKLKILVENTGRLSYMSIHDKKGLPTIVTLNGKKLTRWLQCGINFEKELPKLIEIHLQSISSSGTDVREENDDAGPAVYVGHFAGTDKLQTSYTFFDSRSWVKGFVLVNGFNIGRYWSVLGPQMTLFTPGALFNQQNNVVIVVELLGRRFASMGTKCNSETEIECNIDNFNEFNAEDISGDTAAEMDKPPHIEFLNHPIIDEKC